MKSKSGDMPPIALNCFESKRVGRFYLGLPVVFQDLGNIKGSDAKGQGNSHSGVELSLIESLSKGFCQTTCSAWLMVNGQALGETEWPANI